MSEHTTISLHSSNNVGNKVSPAPALNDHSEVLNQYLLKNLPIQCKLSVGSADDPLEHEADAMADKVMRMPEKNFVQRKCDACKKEDEEKEIRRKPLSDLIQRKESTIDEPAKEFMENRFNSDFGHIQIHTDQRAMQMNRELNSNAFTLGSHIFFDEGQYQPDSDSGKHLLAHELAHTMQQSNQSFPSLIQTKPKKGKAKPPKKPGQMYKDEFLSRLHDQLMTECDIELKKAGRSSKDCPTIVKTIAYYRNQPASSLLRVIHHFAHPPKGASADQLISAVVAKARTVARRIAAGEGTRLQAKSEGSDTISIPASPEIVTRQMGAGQHFNEEVRGKMEAAFGSDFSSIKVHTDSASTELNRQLGSRAFTIGPDIAFGSGQYQPGTSSGDSLIAHELAHTLQQGKQVSEHSNNNYERLEREAEQTAISVTKGENEIAKNIDKDSRELSIQADGVGEVALAVFLFSAEAGTEVVVADSVVVVAADVAVPTVAELAAPAVIESVAPVVIESTAAETLTTAAVDTAATSSWSTAATVATAGTAAVTLSSDSPTEETSNNGSCEEAIAAGLYTHECYELELMGYEFAISSSDFFGGLASKNRGLQKRNVDAPTTDGPCPGVGTHTNVIESNGDYFGSIVCCPCCLQEEAPLSAFMCKLV